MDLAAQDIHFSQFFNTPLALNPAGIGQFEGNYRVGGIYRQQWRSVTIPYRTFGLHGDVTNVAGLEGLGGGVWLFNDRTGDSRLNIFHLSIGTSYAIPLEASKRQWISIGTLVGFSSINSDLNELQYDAQYNGFFYDPARNNGEQFQRQGLTHPDVHLGTEYHLNETSRQKLQLGLAVFNVTTPRIGFKDSPGDPLAVRWNFHAIMQRPVSEKLDVLPMLQFQQQGKYNEFDIGASVRYILLEQYGFSRAVRAGLYYRNADAGYVFAGLDYDDWQFGISYDVNFSKLVPASRNRGGIELTAIRIFRKRALPKRFRNCPDQI